MVDPRTDKPFKELINVRWVQVFVDWFLIVSRSHTGKKKMSPSKNLFIEKDVAFHLGSIKRLLQSGQNEENDIENAYETHFIKKRIQQAHFVICWLYRGQICRCRIGGKVMTMMAHFSTGRDAKIEPPLMIFKNKDRGFPVRSIPDTIGSLSYRCGPKGLMNTTLLPEYFRMQKVIHPLPNRRRRILYVDNCS